MALFNPALGASILAIAADGHLEDSGQGLPWIAGFLVMPFALHQPTRESLPANIRTSLSAWVSANPLLRDGLSGRVSLLAPRTREALRFGLRNGIIAFESSRLVSGTRVRRSTKGAGNELKACTASARLCGRWFAQTDLNTVFTLLGVNP
jgi:hypothetical protein